MSDLPPTNDEAMQHSDSEPYWVDCANCSEGFYPEELKATPDGANWCPQCMAEHFGFGSAVELSKWLVSAK